MPSEIDPKSVPSVNHIKAQALAANNSPGEYEEGDEYYDEEEEEEVYQPVTLNQQQPR